MLLRLITGFVRIALYTRRSTLIETLADGTQLRLAEDIQGPVTYGLKQPVILLPAGFHELTPEVQKAIKAHELIHIQRRDWLHTLAEEFLRALLWFHPAIWFTLARIHATREQTVDQQAIQQLGGTSEPYLHALLSQAGIDATQPDFVPAPLFLRRHHLAERVGTILKEVPHMPNPILHLTAACSAVALTATAFTASLLVPLRAPAAAAEPQEQADTLKNRILHKVDPVYPPEAKLAKIEGPVEMELSINERGMVTDARVLSGPAELRNAAIKAVLQWQFAPGTQSRATVVSNFRLDSNKPDQPPQPTLGIIQAIDLSPLPAALQERIQPRLLIKPGDTFTRETWKAVAEIAVDVDPNLRTSFDNTSGVLQILSSGSSRVADPGERSLRIGGNMQSAKLRTKVAPRYPQAAKEARVQGQVKLEATIDKAGKVANLKLLSGDPELADAAIKAVSQWEYETTLLNGNPVAVVTQIDVNFTLTK
jgi:TonB family protein